MNRVLHLVPIALLAANAVGSDLLGCYFAPAGPGLFRARIADGTLREFIFEAGSTNVLAGADGWTGLIGDGETHIRSPEGAHPQWDYCFVQGRLASAKLDGRPVSVPVAQRPPEMPIGMLWPPDQTIEECNRVWDTWGGGGRLRLWFTNPNRCGAFFALLSLLSLALLFRPKRAFKVGGVLLSFAFAAPMVASGSRGAACAFALGLAFAVAFGWRRFPRTLATVLGVLAILGTVLTLVFSGPVAKMAAERLHLDHSSVQRLVIWEKVPRMIADAPSGWGSVSSGRAYVDWYQPYGVEFMSRTLINDHLTQLVHFGQLMRAGYLFFWSAALTLLLVVAACGKSPVPFAVGIAFWITAFFNPVMGAWEIWTAPVCGLLYAGWAVRRLTPRQRHWLAGSLMLVLVLSLLAVFALQTIGDCMPGQKPQIRKRGETILVNGCRPRNWLVSDDAVLGVGLVEKTMRAFYQANPTAPACGYVYRMEDLPRDVERLVLAGRSGAAYLAGVLDNPDIGKVRLPCEIVFISPLFPPWAIPDEIRKRCSVRILIGEFAAQFDSGYQQIPSWVSVIPSAELYIPGWMQIVCGY